MKHRTPLSEYSDEEILAEAGRRRRAMVSGPTNPKVLRPCPFCKKKFGAREMRTHKPVCPKKPS